MHRALFFEPKENGEVQCRLCPHNCRLAVDENGKCRVRRNTGGVLVSENYKKACAIRFDPVEKKPLYHFFPGKQVLSVGSIGCNLSCRFCQNWEISQTGISDYSYYKNITPEEIISMATKKAVNAGIAFTYNEPTVWIEYLLDIAELACNNNLKCAVVTNGYINEEPLDRMMKVTDAYNVDLKSFSNDFYRDVTGASLKPVLNTIRRIRMAGKHLELTHLVVTNLNDDEVQFTEMVRNELGPSTPLHISRYHPVYKSSEEPTPKKTLQDFYAIAKQHLDFVYLGNLDAGDPQNTYCPDCNSLIVTRNGYLTRKAGLTVDGRCGQCQRKIMEFA